jgi:cbb3-type cytochrome oxidase subunit 3
MIINKILKVLLLLLGGIFIVLQGFAFEVEGAAVSAFTLVLLTVLYCKLTENKSNYFFWFLVTFTLGHLLSLYSYYEPLLEYDQIDYYYYGANLLYIIAYIFLIIKMLKGFDFKTVFSELSIPIIVLVVLDVFCVSIVTATTENVLSFYEYSLEFAYNSVIMTLLSVALINYMYRNDNKSMLFLIGSICIVFSEIIQLAYYYILNDNNLGFIYSFFLVVAFMFFYLQSQVEFTGPEPEYTDEHLKA